MAAADQIIVPLDVPDESAAIALLNRLPQATFWKVGLELFVSVGPHILQLLKERDKKIFLDLKFHDIPNTMAGACRSAARYGVDLMTVHATAGGAALKAAQAALLEGAEASGHPPPNLLAITLLTSLTSRSLAFELKVPVELPEYVLTMALLAQESGLSGIVCSPQEAGQVKEVCGSEFLRVCPGVRPAWAAQADQRRLLTPKDAIQSGANYLVIGRPITASEDPAGAFQRVCEELES
jgi:orotidine-5'-phosphate decarboxylase